MIKIEKGVPIPTRSHGYKYPLPEMEVGDSFVANYERERTIRASIYAFGKKLNRKFIVRREGNTIRVWRVE